MQVVPATHTVEPPHPWPPHCPYFGTVGPLGLLVGVGAAVVAAGVEATGVVGAGLDPPPEDCPAHCHIVNTISLR